MQHPVFEHGSAIPICPFFFECGGCDTQDVRYQDQLITKQSWVELLFGPLLSESTEKHPIIGEQSDFPIYFRNKIRFSFIRNAEGVVQPSRHRKGSKTADIAVDRCYLQSPESEEIINWVAAWATEQSWSLYSPQHKDGWLRHLLIRQGTNTGQILVSTVSDTPSVPGEDAWVAAITAQFPNITSLHHSQTFPLQPEKILTRRLWGSEQIVDTIGEYSFSISPHAFFQTNGTMVEQLYTTALKHAGSGRVLWDLYAGSATIGIFASKNFQSVISIEQNPANILDAQKNREVNAVGNLEIIEGSVEKVLSSAFYKSHGPPDCIIIDPPRAGIHPSLRVLLPNIVKQSPACKLVYVSCNPLTALRDCAAFRESGLEISSFQPIDMFPHSTHCELVLSLKAKRADN